MSELEASTKEAWAVEEARALSWFLLTPHLPAGDVIRLGLWTARLADGDLEIPVDWEPMETLAPTDPPGVFAIVDLTIRRKLRGLDPYIAVEAVRKLLRLLLRTWPLESKAAIYSRFDDPVAFEHARRRGQQYVLDHYSLDAVGNSFLELLNRLVNSGGRDADDTAR